MERIAPSARLEAQIEELLGDELAANSEKLAELGRLGARLVLQRAVEDEVTAFLGRARYARTPEAAGSRNGTRPRAVQTAEGEISVGMPQIRGAAERFISRVFPDSRTVVRTRPLEALIIGGYVRGLSDRDIESLLQEAGLGQVSKSTASRICRELRARYKAFCARSLAEIDLLALFLDAIYLPTRPSGAKEGVLVAWGYTTQGRRVLVAVRLGQRESREDWLDLGRDLARRGLRAPWLVVSDGAPGLVKAIEELWPHADRQRCTVHRSRKDSTCCFLRLGSFAQYGGSKGGRRSTWRSVRGVAAPPERAAAASCAGRGGPAARAWGRRDRGAGRQGQRDHGAPWARRIGSRCRALA